MTVRAWTITREQLIDAIANITVHGAKLPGHDNVLASADDMADAILSKLGPGEKLWTAADFEEAMRAAELEAIERTELE